MNKRFHIQWNQFLKQWQCWDHMHEIYGLGDSPKCAFADCQLELELLMSDMHK